MDKTVGQAAYEAFHRYVIQDDPVAWSKLDTSSQAEWEAIGRAIESFLVGKIVGGLD
jgi:hypothetical protein